MPESINFSTLAKRALAEGLTTAELGRQIGLSQPAVSRLATGKTKSVAADVAIRLINVVVVSFAIGGWFAGRHVGKPWVGAIVGLGAGFGFVMGYVTSRYCAPPSEWSGDARSLTPTSPPLELPAHAESAPT
jgi:transcriptional regulator with XRE-family HTH domain